MTRELPIIGRRVANWVGRPSRLVVQLLLSTWSYVTLPIAHYRKDAVYEYFSELYKGKPETLLFDGKDGRYLDQIKMIYDINNFKEKDILDVGCGDGSLFHWLMRQSITPQSYIGVDFAHPEKMLHNNARITQKDIASVDIEEFKASTITVVNVLVYLNSHLVDSILKAPKQATELIIIEPIQGWFWDAYWGGVRLYYRKPSRIIEMLELEGWQVKGISIDYGTKWMNYFLFPLSYCLLAKHPGDHTPGRDTTRNK